MIVLESKLDKKPEQYGKLDKAIRTAQFIRNKALRYWIDNWGTNKNNLYRLCPDLAEEYEWAGKLNSQARQAIIERAWCAISRFFNNCKKQIYGKKGYPNYGLRPRKPIKKNARSVEYKTTRWKLSDDRKHIVFTDKNNAGCFRLIGTRDLSFYAVEQIKRVRIVRRADGYYVQLCIDIERSEPQPQTGREVGLDLGLLHFYTNSDGKTVENPRLRKAEKALKRQQRRVSKKQKGFKNRAKARKRLAKKHLQVSRQRKDFAVKQSRCVVKSNDLVVYEKLHVKNMVKNHLAKSISDAGWSQFTTWLDYFGKIMARTVVAVPPQYTSQECSKCGVIVKKSLSTRTHTCQCGCVVGRDFNAALVILARGRSTVGHTESVDRQRSTNACGENGLYSKGAI
ncbi:RNA-guided endonuclease InsQ/TnpB family protein [Anthocerotibacter panamensis]|uniref:RNA-guided endonuclease InsQ/TnpB family protein n=1 Tax=Anthocerotibacter panamensis TaxID=2857077 RepID=UPI001C40786B|nr:RNA-guided endonuclease TnpB family protein [Anthocerotibacter panamensis]